MGFSISGSFAIIAVAAFMSFSLVFTASSNGFEKVTDAQDQRFDDDLGRKNTAINVTQADWTASDVLVVEVENGGATTLTVSDTDVVVDGAYVNHSSFSVEQVDGDSSTDLWQPGETYHVEVNESVLNDQIATPPDRVKVVTEYGVSDTNAIIQQ